MCGRFTLASDKSLLSAEFKVSREILDKLPSRFNIAPSQPIACIVHENQTKVDIMNWGFIPKWAKDPSIGNRMINARAETLDEKPSFKGPLRTRRCLVMADGFYEWKREGSGKIPYYIRLRNHHPFGFAGLWSEWMSPDGSEIHSCTIITTGPNQLMESIHHRMPVILPKDQREYWLDPRNHTPKELLALLKPYSSDEMEAFVVSKFVNTPANDSKECIAPA